MSELQRSLFLYIAETWKNTAALTNLIPSERVYSGFGQSSGLPKVGVITGAGSLNEETQEIVCPLSFHIFVDRARLTVAEEVERAITDAFCGHPWKVGDAYKVTRVQELGPGIKHTGTPLEVVKLLCLRLEPQSPREEEYQRNFGTVQPVARNADGSFPTAEEGVRVHADCLAGVHADPLTNGVPGVEPPLASTAGRSVNTTAVPLGCTNDEVASAFFKARECEAYYQSLQGVDRQRDFHDQLTGVLVRLLSFADGDGRAFLDDLVAQAGRERQAEVAMASGQGLFAVVTTYRWAVRRLLFAIALDDWALDEAKGYLGELASDKATCLEHEGERIIGLLEPACKLTERLCAAGRADGASTSLAVAQEALRVAQARGLNLDGVVRKAEESVAGTHKPRFLLNHARQVENARKLGAIDEKRHRAALVRLDRGRSEREAERRIQHARLDAANFVASLPIDARLEPSGEVTRLVPYPRFNYRAENLTPDQQAEYLKAFRDADDVDLLAKYADVRLSGLIRSAIYYVGQSDLVSFLAEVETLALIEPNCRRCAQGVKEILGILSTLSGSQRAAYAARLVKLLAELLEPETLPLEPQDAIEVEGLRFNIQFAISGLHIQGAELSMELSDDFFDRAQELASEYGAA